MGTSRKKAKASKKKVARRQPAQPPAIDDDAPEGVTRDPGIAVGTGTPTVTSPPIVDKPKPVEQLASPVSHLYRVKRDCTFGNRRYSPDRLYPEGAGVVRLQIVSAADVPPYHFHPLDNGPVNPPPDNDVARRHEKMWARQQAAHALKNEEPLTFLEYAKQQSAGKPLGAPE